MNRIQCILTAAAAGTMVAMCARANDANQPATNPPENGALTVAPSDTNPSSNFDEDQIGLPKYRDQELDIDLFGSGVLGEETIEHISGSRFRHRSLWGGGGGATFFFLKYLGVGGDFDADAHGGRFVDNAAGNVYLRLPIYNTGLAPYIFGGGGYQFEDLRQAFGDGGGGLEFRLCKHLGIFADGRYVGTAQTKSYVEARAGVRIAF